MKELHAIIRFKVHQGKLEEFRRVAARCIETVRTRDSGTLRYEWFLNADQSEGIVQETYRSSEAYLEHVKNLREALDALRSLASLSAEILGTPSPELTQTFKARGVPLFYPFQS
ncbi:MAG TPA: antibiotic biosynthesis monooxygenase [Myxococcaceae bacterium]|nr:antibiotic biosynthesis monooxygenase [Myxococcaceae bacterium]